MLEIMSFFMESTDYAEKSPVSTDTGFGLLRLPGQRQASFGTPLCSGIPDGF